MAAAVGCCKTPSRSHRLLLPSFLALFLLASCTPHTSAQLNGCNFLAPIAYSMSAIPTYNLTAVNGYTLCFSISVKATSGAPSSSNTPYASWMGGTVLSSSSGSTIISCENYYATWQTQLIAAVGWPSDTSVSGKLTCCASQNCNAFLKLSRAAAAAKAPLLLLLSSLAAALLLFTALT